MLHLPAVKIHTARRDTVDVLVTALALTAPAGLAPKVQKSRGLSRHLSRLDNHPRTLRQ
jgi:hypothetical protein